MLQLEVPFLIDNVGSVPTILPPDSTSVASPRHVVKTSVRVFGRLADVFVKLVSYGLYDGIILRISTRLYVFFWCFNPHQ